MNLQKKTNPAYPSALPLYFHLANLSRATGDRLGEAKALSNIGMAYSSDGDYSSAQHYFEQSLGISREIGDREGYMMTCYSLVLHYIAQHDRAKASLWMAQAVEIAKEIGHPNLADYQRKLVIIATKINLTYCQEEASATKINLTYCQEEAKKCQEEAKQ